MGILSPHYALVFDGVSAWEQSSSGFQPGMDVTTEGTLYNLTGGTHKYVDMGRSAGIFTIEVGVEATQRTSLEGKRGVSGSLVWSRGTQTATLLDILPSQVDQVNANRCSLRFFSDDMPSTVTPSAAMLTETSSVLITETGSTMVIE